MPKPFWTNKQTRNFTGSGTIFGSAQTKFDRRVDWTSNIPSITEFPTNGVSYFGRTSIFATSAGDEAAYAGCSPTIPDLFCASSGGTGRGNGPGAKRIDADDGSTVWETGEAATYGASETRLVESNSPVDRHLFDVDDAGNTYAVFRSDWVDSSTAPTFSGPTTTATTSGTSHTVNIPSVSADDLLIAIFTTSANVTITPPGGNWEQRKTDPFGTGEAFIWALLGATGSEGATVSFGTSASCDASWHVYKFAAGEWDDDGTPTAAEVIDLGTDSESTGTSPNPGDIVPFNDNGEYALIAICHVDDGTETFSGYPTGFSGGSYTASSNTVTATAYKTGPGENADAFTKSASANYNTNVIGIRTGAGEGLIKDNDFAGVMKIDPDGNMDWWTQFSSTGTSGRAISVKPDGSSVFVSCVGNMSFDGVGAAGTSGHEWVELDGSDGSFINEWDEAPQNPFSASQTQCLTVFGASMDRVLLGANGATASTTAILTCLDASNLEATPLWSLDKTSDFAISWNVIDRCIPRPGGGVTISTGDTNSLYIFFIDDDGTISNELDISGDTSGLGLNPSIRGIFYDKYGHLFVYTYGASGADVLRYDQNLTLVWSMAADLGVTQGIASSANFAAEVPLMAYGFNIAVGSTGVIYITEQNATGIDDAHVGRFIMV